MPKVATTLSDLQVRRLKEDGVYFVGGVVGKGALTKCFCPLAEDRKSSRS